MAVEFVRGRLKFDDQDWVAPFSSMGVVFNNENRAME